MVIQSYLLVLELIRAYQISNCAVIILHETNSVGSKELNIVGKNREHCKKG